VQRGFKNYFRDAAMIVKSNPSTEPARTGEARLPRAQMLGFGDRHPFPPFYYYLFYFFKDSSNNERGEEAP
jgi:hypothetical protein